ncbi:Putative ribonuclease H protein At1g65750 [Linum perenne]
MSETPCLGKYFGVPILHGRATNAHFKYILANIDAKLTGWKSNSLSLAGRVTLATSVLNAIPAYSMQTTVLPNHICEQIDQRIRSFVWGSEQGKRKVHLVKWEDICRPKDLGGLGLRSAQSFNRAFILKLAWGILKRPKELWANLLLTKYLKPTTGGFTPRNTKRFSGLWKGIKEVWPTLNAGLQWSIRDGKSTSFWLDQWLDSGQKLYEHATCQDQINPDTKVADFVDQNGNWDFANLNDVLPVNLVEAVAGMSPPMASLGEDTPTWGLEGHGEYTVKSGYLLINDLCNDGVADDKIWKSIWSWNGPNKVRHFMWLVSHNRLMTNKERKRRHLADIDTCSVYLNREESIDHVLRECPIAVQVWQRLGLGAQINLFISMDFNRWWKENITFEDLSRRDWEVTINHIFRESNFLADSLAAKGHSVPLGTHAVEASDPTVARWCAYDRSRSSQPRLVLRPL